MWEWTGSFYRRTISFVHRARSFVDQYRTALAVLIVLALFAVALASSEVSAREQTTNEKTIQNWVNQLNDAQPTTARLQAQQQLEHAGKSAVDALTASLHASNPTMRQNAAEVLGYIAAPITAGPLQDVLLHDNDAQVRVQAAFALGNLKNAAVSIPLKRVTVLDSDPSVRQAARGALQTLYANIATMANQDIQSARALAVPAALPTLVYLAVSNHVVVSADSGKTWSAESQLPSSILTLEMSPSDPNQVYAGTESLGLYRSDDRGVSWIPVSNMLGKAPGSPVSASAIAIDPNDPQHLYVARGTYIGTSDAQLFPLGIVESRDGGRTWSDANFPNTSEGITRLFFNERTLYALAGDRIVSASQ